MIYHLLQRTCVTKIWLISFEVLKKVFAKVVIRDSCGTWHPTCFREKNNGGIKWAYTVTDILHLKLNEIVFAGIFISLYRSVSLLWPPNVAGWWLAIKGSYPNRKAMAAKRCRTVTDLHGLLPKKSHDRFTTWFFEITL